jgi:hypothetical protein
MTTQAAPWAVFLRQEAAPHERGYAEDREEVRRDVLAREVLSPAQQNVHGAVIEPLPVQPQLAARIDQPIHHQQLRPSSALCARGAQSSA